MELRRIAIRALLSHRCRLRLLRRSSVLSFCSSNANASEHEPSTSQSDVQLTLTSDNLVTNVLQQYKLMETGRHYIISDSQLNILSETIAQLCSISESDRQPFELRRFYKFLLANPEFFTLFSGHAKAVQERIEFLRSYHLTTVEALNILVAQPKIIEMSLTDVYTICAALKQSGLSPLNLSRVLTKMPSVFVEVTPNEILQRSSDLNEFFSRKQLSSVLGFRPNILLMDITTVEPKYEYIHFNMGVSQHDISQCVQWLDLSLDQIQLRHRFICLTGAYVHPNPKMSEAKLNNPRLSLIFSPDAKRFAEKAAHVSLEVWQCFERLYGSSGHDEHKLMMGDDGVRTEVDDEHVDGEQDVEETG